MIDLHYWPTPNGKKVTILLEELGLEYRIVPVAIGLGDQFQPEFLRISPNNRMPAIVDHDPLGAGEPLSIFESGAILVYLAEKAGRFGGNTPRERYDTLQWVFWQMANQGPKSGEFGHFRRLGDAVGDQTYARTRFENEVHRLYGVMNNQLYDRRYLTGDRYSIGDMASYPWALAMWERFDPDDFQYVGRWLKEVGARAAVQLGMKVGAELSANVASLSDEEKAARRAVLYTQRARPAPEGGLLE